MSFERQLSINRYGVVKRGAQTVSPLDLHHGDDEYLKWSTVNELQQRFPEHTIWLVGEFIHAITAKGHYRVNWADFSKLESYFRMNIQNLEIHAAFLDKLEPKLFDIRAFAVDKHGDELKVHAAECMAVGCAVGWGPAAGFQVSKKDTGWPEYSRRVFGLHPTHDRDEWEWCFSSVWAKRDNTPAGAARRIRYLIQYGLPEDHEKQRFGEAPYACAG